MGQPQGGSRGSRHPPVPPTSSFLHWAVNVSEGGFWCPRAQASSSFLSPPMEGHLMTGPPCVIEIHALYESKSFVFTGNVIIPHQALKPRIPGYKQKVTA